MADGCLDNVIYQQNCRKTEEEVRAVQAAQNVADKMFTEVLNYVHAGMNDMELQKIVGVLLRDFGSERDSYDHVTGGWGEYIYASCTPQWHHNTAR